MSLPKCGRGARVRLAAVALIAALVAPPLAAAAPGPDGPPEAPVLTGLGDHSWPVTTSAPRAQQFFDQGLALLYAYNHAESLRAFREAARLDPNLAMAYWGQAMALGPNLNAPLPEEKARQAYAAVQQARAVAARASDRERALVEALAVRFAPDAPADRQALDAAYAVAMTRVAALYPNDTDVLTLFADALMNTMPWNYWQADGAPKADTVKVLAALEKAMGIDPRHAGAHHYYIHAIEASDNPDRAVPSADVLGDLMPAAGHMVHMPAHIYLRVGRYADAAEANVRAIAADEDYLAQCQAQGLYPVSYYPHNLHFLWAAATLEGRRAVAVDAARRTAEQVPHHHAGALAWTADFPVTPWLAYIRFGMWPEMLTAPAPPATEPYAAGIRHYGRALGFLAGGRLDRADAEHQALEAIKGHEAFRTTLKDLLLAGNLEIASRIVDGELAAARGRVDEAVRLLREGVALEDAIPYNEPPVWHHPVRQTLGAVLLEAGRAAEAEAVYRADLVRVRENGWSLFGLARSLEAQGKVTEAAEARRRFDTAWARADTTIDSSRVLKPAAPAGRPSTAARGFQPKSLALPTGVTLSYVEQGDPSGPALVMMHGLTDSWFSYSQILPHLPAGWRAVAVSTRGHGDSSRPAGYSATETVADVAALMDALGIPSAIIVGHSMGGTHALTFAARYPQRTRGLVLIDAFGRPHENAGVAELEGLFASLTDPVAEAFVREWQESTVTRPLAPGFLDTVVAESRKVPARVWRGALAGFTGSLRGIDLTTIRMPALVLWGDKDAFVPREDQEFLVSQLGGARLVVYEGTGHAPHWEEPQRTAGDIIRFVEAVLANRATSR